MAEEAGRVLRIMTGAVAGEQAAPFFSCMPRSGWMKGRLAPCPLSVILGMLARERRRSLMPRTGRPPGPLLRAGTGACGGAWRCFSRVRWVPAHTPSPGAGVPDVDWRLNLAGVDEESSVCGVRLIVLATLAFQGLHASQFARPLRQCAASPCWLLQSAHRWNRVAVISVPARGGHERICPNVTGDVHEKK